MDCLKNGYKKNKEKLHPNRGLSGVEQSGRSQ